jgi:hypothetical protein
MLDKFIFENHLGQRFDGLANGVYLNYSDLRDYSWSYESINNRISRFYRPTKDRKLPLVVYCSSEEKAIEVKNRLFDLAEADIEAMLPGKIRIGDYYTNGFITASEKSNYLINKRLCALNLTFTSDDPAWYKEHAYTFATSGNNDSSLSGGTDYNYGYPYAYALRLVGRSIFSDAVGSSAFKLLIYGEVENPTITIGEHTYTINGTVGAGETLLIDSLTKTITLTTATGEQTNWFDKRSRDSYIFEPIPSGKSPVEWSGEFGFDLTVIEKRSEPRWT